MSKTLEAIDNVMDTEVFESELFEAAKPKEAAEPEEEMIKPYTLRKLNNGDLRPVVRIFSKIGLKEFSAPFFSVVTKEKEVKDVGIDVALNIADILVSNIGKALDDIDAWCADLAGVSVEELNAMEFGTTIMIIYDVFSDMKNTSFFKVVSKLLA